MNSIGASLAASAAKGLLNSASGGSNAQSGAGAAGLPRWEYARLESTGTGVGVVFTHREPWPRQAPETFFDTMRRLGDEGWELVSALPLAATVSGEHMRLDTDRWLMFKRPYIEPPPSAGEDVLKGLVNRQLRGRLSIP
jgi:hypothetical protein